MENRSKKHILNKVAGGNAKETFAKAGAFLMPIAKKEGGKFLAKDQINELKSEKDGEISKLKKKNNELESDLLESRKPAFEFATKTSMWD